MLWLFYGLLFLWQAAWLIGALRKKRGWISLLILSLASLAAALGFVWYYSVLPGQGSMVGWAYFREVFYSIVHGGVYLLMALVAGIGSLFSKK